jgi:hypothetical protein
MENPDKAIICGACKVSVVTPLDPKPHDQIICPRCGARDAFEKVWKICMEEVKDRFRRAADRDIATYDRKLGRPSQRATPGDSEKPLFKWQFRD